MARIVVAVDSDYARRDAREELEKLGFVILDVHDESFYTAQPPAGWWQEPYGTEYVVIGDEKKQRRIIQFFGGILGEQLPYMYIDALPGEFATTGNPD